MQLQCCYDRVYECVGDCIVSCGAWSDLQAGIEGASITCLLPLQQSTSGFRPHCECSCLLFSVDKNSLGSV